MARNYGIFIGAILVCLLLLPAGVRAETANLSILYTGDTHGHLRSFYHESSKPVGGVAKRAIYFAEKRRHTKNMTWLTLDAGDALSGTALSEVFKGYLDIEAMNRLQYDAMVLGVHDFDYGVEVLRQRISEAQFKILAANVVDEATGQAFTEAYTIIERDGIRIGILGLTTGELADRVAPQNFTGLRVNDPIETARQLVPVIRAQSDIVVALTHMGINEDIKLASQLQDIDIIVGGMSHSELQLPMKVGRTLIVHDSAYGKTVGLLKLSFEKNQQPWFRKWFDCKLEPMAGLWMENSNYVGWLDSYQEQMAIQMGVVVGTGLASMSALKVSSSETPLGNYVTDLLRERFNADVAILPAQFFQNGLPEGPILLGDLYSSLPWSHYAGILNVTGGELKEILDDAAGQIGRPGFPQVSGASFGILYGNATNIMVNGQPIDPFATYKLVTSSYLADGNLGYATMANITDKDYTGLLVRDIVRDRLATGQVASATLSQRIVFMASDPNAGSTPPQSQPGTQPPASSSGQPASQPPATPPQDVPASGQQGGQPAAGGQQPPASGNEIGQGSQQGSTPEVFNGQNGQDDLERNDQSRGGNQQVVIEDEVITDTGSEVEPSGGQQPASGSQAQPQAPPSLGSQAPPAATGTTVGQDSLSRNGLEYRFALLRDGDDFKYQLQITNATGQPVELTFSDGERFDFMVYEGADFKWNYHKGWFFVQSIQTDTISSGETLTYSGEWRGVDNDGSALPPGSYRFVAEHKLMNDPVQLQFDAVLPQ